MLRVSSIVTRECLRQTLRRHVIAEAAVIGSAAVLAGAAFVAIQADAAGNRWPAMSVALVAAGLGATALGAILIATGALSTRAVAGRVDAVGARVEESGRDLRELRRSVDELRQMTQSLGVGQRAIIAELGRMRVLERDQEHVARVNAIRLAAAGRSAQAAANVVPMPGPESLQAARNLASRLFDSERRRAEDNFEDTL